MLTFKSLFVFASAAVLLSCTAKVEHKAIAPLPSGIDTSNLSDCTVAASFTSDDFRWMGGNLRMTVYNTILYDAVEISRMQEGDTLIFGAEPVVIQRIERTDNGLEINGGLDEGGPWLVAEGGGTYIARTWNDHAVYSKAGRAEVALDEGFIIIDCGLNPQDPVDTVCTNQKLYIERLTDSQRSFNYLNTWVTIEDGMITEINRHWIP